MKIKTLASAMALTLINGALAAQTTTTDGIIVLDLSKATTDLEFNSSNGAWTGTYDDDETEIESQVFSFVHNSMGEYQTWWGFTASNSTNNSRPANSFDSFSNMASGGIMLNEDGTIKTDAYGAPVTSADMPYLVGFAMTGFSRHPADMTFTTDKSYEPVGAYFNLNSVTYYCIEDGDGFARAFNNGDNFKLIIHGISPDEDETTLEVELASYTNGNLTINRGWTYVDLSELGVVDQIWFSMDGTDKGAYGLNTPAYFCMDKLMVRPASEGGVKDVRGDKVKIRYDRSTRTVYLDGETFAMVYDTAGRCVMSCDGQESFSVESLDAGVYVVKSGNSKIKIAR